MNKTKYLLSGMALLLLVALFFSGLMGALVFGQLGAGTTDVWRLPNNIKCGGDMPSNAKICGDDQGTPSCLNPANVMCKVAVNSDLSDTGIAYNHYCIPSTSSCGLYSYDGFRGFLASEEPVKCYDESVRGYMLTDGNKCLSASNITVECPASKPYAYKSLTAQYAGCISTNDPKALTESVLLCEQANGYRYYYELGSRDRVSASFCFNNEDEVIGCPKTFKLVQKPYTFTSTRGGCVSETQSTTPPPTGYECPFVPSGRTLTLQECRAAMMKSLAPSPPSSPKPTTTTCGPSEGLCKKGAVEQCMSTCPVNWTFILPDGFTIVPSALGSKYVTGMKDGKTFEEFVLPTRTETVIVRETVWEEISVVAPPKDANTATCTEYQKSVSEEVVLPGQAAIRSAEARLKEAKLKDPVFQKAFIGGLKKAVTRLREVDKMRAKLPCTPEGIKKLSDAITKVETEDLRGIKQDLVFIDKEVKVQNKWVGIQEIFNRNQKTIRTIKKDQKTVELFEKEIEGQVDLERRLEELLEIEKTGKIFEFEMETIFQEAKDLQASFEAKLKTFEKPKNSEKTLRKGSSDKKVLKKSSKKKKSKEKKKKGK